MLYTRFSGDMEATMGMVIPLSFLAGLDAPIQKAIRSYRSLISRKAMSRDGLRRIWATTRWLDSRSRSTG